MADNPRVTRRVHVEQLTRGELTLSIQQSHHLRDVLRLEAGEDVEVFDSAGSVAPATILRVDPQLVLQVHSILAATDNLLLSVFSAVPKGDRADWMVEKLSELGVSRWIPLRTDRSVVHPEGKGKLDRWERLAVESARQCRRAGVMKIESLTSLESALSPQASADMRVYLSTVPDTPSLLQQLDTTFSAIDLFIGPEGGWSPDELELMASAGLTGAALTTTILRVETAAVAASAVVATHFAQMLKR